MSFTSNFIADIEGAAYYCQMTAKFAAPNMQLSHNDWDVQSLVWCVKEFWE